MKKTRSKKSRDTVPLWCNNTLKPRAEKSDRRRSKLVNTFLTPQAGSQANLRHVFLFQKEASLWSAALSGQASLRSPRGGFLPTREWTYLTPSTVGLGGWYNMLWGYSPKITSQHLKFSEIVSQQGNVSESLSDRGQLQYATNKKLSIGIAKRIVGVFGLFMHIPVHS